MLVVATAVVLFPGVISAQDDDWNKTEQDLTVQLDQLDADLKVMDEQLKVEELLEATGEAVFVQQSGKMVQVMSEKAVTASLINRGIISWTDVKKEDRAVNLTEENGVATYEVAGILQQKLLWIWQVDIEKKVIVKAETGEVIRQDMGLGARILDWVSF